MSQQQYQAVVNRAASDPSFMQLLLTNPDQALSGYNLTPAEKTKLESMTEQQLMMAATSKGFTGEIRGATP